MADWLLFIYLFAVAGWKRPLPWSGASGRDKMSLKNKGACMKKILLWIFTVIVLGAAVAASSAKPPSATVPMVLDHNRMTVDIELVRTDGSLRRERAWVDTGGTSVILAETLARDLGVDLAGMPAGGEHSFSTPIPVLALQLGGIALDTEGMTIAVHPGRFARPGVQASCVLPARCLRRLHIVFDYPARQLTVARPGVLTPRGTAVSCRVNPETGLFMIETTIDSGKVALGVDTGSAGTWVTDKLTAAWLVRHSDWPRAVGAAGSTNFFGFPFETQGRLLCLPAMAIGPLAIAQEIAVLGLDQSMFDWYSKKSAAPVAGFIGADLIARFRLEIDFPAGMSWWQPGPPPAARDLDMIGITLRAELDGSFSVAGVVTRNGRPVVDGVQPGDKLLGVDRLDAANAPMGTVIDALRGKPGASRTLRLQREGKAITILATVVRLP
jgi:hypothetical protein